MGIIEDSIFANYKKALEAGDLEQAQKAVNMAKELKTRVEMQGFIDYSKGKLSNNHAIGDFYDPFPYRYYPEDGIVVVNNSAVNLTKSENKLFYLFSKNETKGTEINIVTESVIKNFLWPEKKVTNNAVRIAVHRLRRKLEPDSEDPQILIGIYNKGYLFLGKRTG
jgi:DNA-binding response OmpR family regulator